MSKKKKTPPVSGRFPISDSTPPVLTPEEVEELSNNVVEDFSYEKKIDDERMLELKTKLWETDANIELIKAEKKEAMNQFKDRLAPEESIRRTLIDQIGSGLEWVEETVYEIYNYTDSTVAIYNMAGQLVGERPLHESERQMGF